MQGGTAVPDSHNYLFVSDLHLGAGRDGATGKTALQEDFLHDDAFARFLVYYAHQQAEGKALYGSGSDHYRTRPWKLIINGDLFEFMQITALIGPGPFTWKEKKYGPGTLPDQSVRKLEINSKGHWLFFQALAWFLAHEEYELIILKGNHDLDLYWTEVQRRFCELLDVAYRCWKTSTNIGCSGDSPLPADFFLADKLNIENMKVRFPPSFCYEEDVFYAEHGGQYNNSFLLGTWIPSYENPTLPNGTSDPSDLIRLPIGSLFMRYIFNKAELYHPFAENMKPELRYLIWLFKNWPKGALRILFEYIILGGAFLALKKFNDLWHQFWGTERPPHVKKDQDGCSNPEMSEDFRLELPVMQLKVAKYFNKEARKALIRVALSLWFRVISVIFWLASLHYLIFISRLVWNLDFIDTGYLWLTALFVVLAAVTSILATYLFDCADDVLETPFLREAAEKINDFLTNDSKGPGKVPYYIFGHDHKPFVQKLNSGNKSDKKGPWYINTGYWAPEFDRDNPFRKMYKLTYFCLMPGSPCFNKETPHVLEWLPEADRPRVAVIPEEKP